MSEPRDNRPAELQPALERVRLKQSLIPFDDGSLSAVWFPDDPEPWLVALQVAESCGHSVADRFVTSITTDWSDEIRDVCPPRVVKGAELRLLKELGTLGVPSRAPSLMLIRRDAAIVACLLCRTEEGRRLRKVLAQVVIPQMLDGQAQISTQAVTPVQLAALATTLNDAAERREAQYWARLEAKLAEHQARSDQRDEQIAEIASRRYFDDQPKLRWQKRTDERWLASSAFLVFQHDWFLASNLVERARRDRMLHEGLRAIAPGPDGEFDSFELGRFITRHSDRDIPDGDVIWRIEVMPKEKRRRGVGNFYRVWGRPRDAALPIPATPLFPAPPPAGGTP